MSKIPNVGIVVALKEEFEVLKNTFNIYVTGKSHDKVTYITYETCYKTKYDSELQLIFLLLDDMGGASVASATQWFVSKYDFCILINIGLAGLLSKDCHLLDVIVGDGSYEYDYRIKIRDNDQIGTFEIKHAGRYFSTSKQLSYSLSQLQLLYPSVYEEWEQASRNTYRELMNNLEEDTLNNLKREKLLLDTQVISKGLLACGCSVGMSNQFKTFLLDQNRLVLAMDMESAGFLQTISTIKPQPLSLVIKTISDPADERKNILDDIKFGILRKIAMKNASNLLKIFLDIYDFNRQKFIKYEQIVINEEHTINDSDYLHMKTLNNLGDFFRKESCSNDDLKTWGKIFYQISSKRIIDLKKDSYINDLFVFINNSNSDAPLSIIGNPGTGISPCLSALYHVFYDNYQNNQTVYYPIYIDFRKYREEIYKDTSNMVVQAREFVRSEMKDTLLFLSKHKINNILLIFNDVERDAKFQNSLENEVVTIFKSFSNKKIIGARHYSKQHTKQAKIERKDDNANIVFSSISIEDTKFNEIVILLCLLEKKSADPAVIKKILEKSNINTIDIFLLQLICKNIEQLSENEDIQSLLEEFCLDHIDKHGGEVSIDDIAKFAFDYKIKSKHFKENELYSNPAWYLFNRNKEIECFLIAKHVVNLLLLLTEKNENFDPDLDIIYPDKIDFYRIFLINSNASIQQSILSVASKILNGSQSYAAHANALYLLGRLSNEVIKEEAKKIIREYLDRKDMKIESQMSLVEDNKSLLALRTCYISLAYLGDNSASEQYIEKLLSSSTWCSINRGFHLKYYGDMGYDLPIGLIADDNLSTFHKTYTYLYNRINTVTKTPLFDIEVYTFFSLIQHRHKDGKFNNPQDLEEIVSLIDKVLGKITHRDLKLYLNVLKDVFAKPVYSHFALLRQINNLKFEKRRGWISRGFKKDIEVVSSHILNTVYMASLLLPDKPNILGYDKNKIINMLLYHDLAVCVTHDHLPNERNGIIRAQEKDFYNKLSLYRTYGFYNVKYIHKLWNEFENPDNINSIIAKEIGQLESYAQFLSYIDDGETITKDEFKVWKKEIDGNIITKISIEIMEFIEKEFSQVLSKYNN